MAMFSVVLPGRPCLTEAVPIQPDPNTPPTNFAFTFPAAPRFSHIVVFLLPGVTLPPDVAAAVYIQFPTQQQQPEFRFLGAIGNEKPSAIFKVSLPGSLKTMTEAEQENEMMDEGADAIDPNVTITLGIAIESTQVVREKLATLQQPSTGLELVKRAGQSSMTTKVLAQRIIGNAFNFLASFAASDPRAQGEEVISLKSFRDWWAKFERRIEADPGFLEREAS
ncbi:DUF775 domain-containing protein [Nannizzia gypsea CBS 118893]|uniref:DUF775 domain-containing protein n=1 Tax=Arthroderma gypseum (strain ATCC MYA-4604 / CBS 118893) TaxID=535722 RepID=E4URL5_ARTGP|nr:DUF775 domain-containing protein [Nannizzia gypsea CBS 118893]EFR00225.1 DUF775 domain-containing protein [Nannizzia gypsea CBS 118893]